VKREKWKEPILKRNLVITQKVDIQECMDHEEEWVPK
jgi:hypothetical protein